MRIAWELCENVQLKGTPPLRGSKYGLSPLQARNNDKYLSLLGGTFHHCRGGLKAVWVCLFVSTKVNRKEREIVCVLSSLWKKMKQLTLLSSSLIVAFFGVLACAATALHQKKSSAGQQYFNCSTVDAKNCHYVKKYGCSLCNASWDPEALDACCGQDQLLDD